MKRTHKLTPKMLADMKTDYMSDMPIGDICSKWNINIGTLNYHFGPRKQYGYKVKRGPNPNAGRKEKILFNFNYFDKIDSPDKAYFLGWLASDGHVSKDGYSVTIWLKDREPIEWMAKQLEHKTGPKTDGRGYHGLVLSNKHMNGTLRELGLEHDKTYTLTFREYPYMSHFIRGFFDGDGSAYIRKDMGHPVISFACITGWANGLQEYLDRVVGIKGGSIDGKGLTYGGRVQMEALRDYMYKEAMFSLERKRAVLYSIQSKNAQEGP